MSSLSHHGIKGQRWGVRRFQNKDGTRTAAGKRRNFEKETLRVINKLSNEPKPIKRRPFDKDKVRQRGLLTKVEADQCAELAAGLYKNAEQVEPKITGDVIRVVSSTSAKMYGLEHRLKQPTSIAAKIGSDAKGDGVSFEEAASGIKDTIRYTAVSDSRDYVDTYNAIKQRLRDNGYEETKCKNYFQKYQNGEVLHKAVQSTFKSPDGIDFEFQFQTPESQAAKELKLPIYNERRKAGNTPERNAHLEQEMRNLAELVPDPEGVFSIQSHSGVKNIKHTSIGGTMYIEGNALILGDSSYLEHHGILGQKWGVRRFQNKDGTRTALGRKRDANKDPFKADRLRRKAYEYVSTHGTSLRGRSKAAKMFLEAEKYEEHPETPNEVAARAKAIATQDIIDAVNIDDSLHDEKFLSYLEKENVDKEFYEEIIEEKLTRAARYSLLGYDIQYNYGEKDKPLTRKEKEQNAYIQRQRDYLDTRIAAGDKQLKRYREHMPEPTLKHTSIGGTMYIEGNALILGDSSYLEHHGIRGQRWGVRRFQNRDGSLTNAGRKRLGYATKGATQTVGKAFKAGVKAGGNAVKAVKAHHEKKEAEKLVKKKEKASQSRLGVLANKDLFTDDELRALNQRFKVEDELKMASIQKGVEIAKAVGTIASNAATAAKAYEDITGQSLSPIKRQAAELKKQQDAEDRARKIAREDAEEARKVAQEERNVKTYEQELRKATASADKEEFLAKKTKAQADQEILKALKGARDFDKPDDDDPPKPPNGGGGNPPGGGSDNSSSWVQKATAGGKNPFEEMLYENDPEYKAAKDAHDEKVARKERMEYLDKHIAEREQEKQAEKAAKDKALMDMINQSNARTGRGQSTPPKESQPETSEPTKTPRQDSDALFSQKGSLPIDKDRYRNRKAAEKAKKVKEDVAEDRAKKQDEKAVDKTIDDVIAAQRKNTELMRNMDPHAYDRAVAKEYVKEKAKETIDKIPETLGNLNPINRAAKKIANKVEQEGYENTRKAMKEQYERMAEAQGRDEANYVMYNTRIAGLQGQGYTEQKAKQIADSDSTFSAKRSRQREYSQRAVELETARKKTVKKLDQAEKNAVDDYYKKIYLDAYAPGTPKREALDKEYRSTMDKIGKLREENQDLYDKSMREAKKILEHSFSIQNGVLFIDESVSLSHHGIKGQRWGVRRFQNPDGTLTEKGRKHYEKALAKEKRKQASSDAIRGTLERQHPFAVTGSAIAGAIAAGMSIAATGGASVTVIAAGSAISAAVSAGLTHATYSVSEAWEGRGTKMRSKKIAKYENMLKQSDVEEGMYHVENGTLFINAGEPYLEHHGVLGMKWGKHLRAGKGPASAPASAGGGGGGAPEEDEETKKKIEEAAKKAGMSVDDYRKKFADKVAEIKKAAYNAAGGNHKTEAGRFREMSRSEQNKARQAEGKAHENSAKAASQDRKYGSGGDVYRRAADMNKRDAEVNRGNAKMYQDIAQDQQSKYEKSLAGRYDKMKADRERKSKMKRRKMIEDAFREGRTTEKTKKVSVAERVEKKLGVTHEKTRVKKQSRGAKRIEDMYKDAARRDGMQAKRKKRVKHSDDTNAIYTEGTRLVVNSKWG